MHGELVVDERGRTSLARVRSHHHDRYTVEEFPDGTLVLTPAITISPLELAALRDPAVMAAVAEAKTGDRSALRRRRTPGTQEDLRSLQPAQASRSASASNRAPGGRTQALCRPPITTKMRTDASGRRSRCRGDSLADDH